MDRNYLQSKTNNNIDDTTLSSGKQRKKKTDQKIRKDRKKDFSLKKKNLFFVKRKSFDRRELGLR
jgi:hypothetical protein